MPYINIRIGTRLTKQQELNLYHQTTQLMNQVMGKNPLVTVVHIDQSNPGSWSVNQTTLTANDPVPAYVDIKITEGTNTAEQKHEMLHATMQMLKNTVGATQEACYIVIDDIAADSWGYNGLSQADRAKQT